MWIQVDPTHAGEVSWVNPSEILRCDVNTNPEPPWAVLSLRNGDIATVSDPVGMKALQKAIGTELPRAP